MHGFRYMRAGDACKCDRHKRFALRRLITKLEILRIPGLRELCGLRNLTSGRNSNEMDNWRTTPQNDVFAEISNGQLQGDYNFGKNRPQRPWRNHIDGPGSRIILRNGGCKWVVWRWRGRWVFSQYEEMGKAFCPNVFQPLLENIDRRRCKDGSRDLFPVFHRRGRLSPPAVALTLEHLEGVPS